MALGKLFKSLLGGGASQTPTADPVAYKGFTIEAAPINEDGKYRSAGFISGELDHSLAKARQIIDEQGQSLLQKTHL